MARPIRILGIDPGLRRTGWGVIEVDGNRLIYVACGSARSDDKAALGERLVTLHDELVRVVDAFRPDEAAVEATFVNKDAAATLKLGQARGIALVVPAKAGVVIAEYAPNLVKKTIVGAGHCDKSQIRMMLGVLLPKADPKSHDAADALAIAITHAHHRQSATLKAMARFSSPSPRSCGERVEVRGSSPQAATREDAPSPGAQERADLSPGSKSAVADFDHSLGVRSRRQPTSNAARGEGEKRGRSA
jgi:crossover junction endodeoxyribonuclease RuvC